MSCGVSWGRGSPQPPLSENQPKTLKAKKKKKGSPKQRLRTDKTATPSALVSFQPLLVSLFFPDKIKNVPGKVNMSRGRKYPRVVGISCEPYVLPFSLYEPCCMHRTISGEPCTLLTRNVLKSRGCSSISPSGKCPSSNNSSTGMVGGSVCPYLRSHITGSRG